ncbi:MAG: Uma2 family endonuclease [Armatimonadota bacterium]|nr:Uma2 family endonuclease [Armatimonadota bacterium]
MVILSAEMQKELQEEERIYPGSDGKPMADNTKQLRWIVIIYTGLASMLKDAPNVFIAADLLWYPEHGHPEIRVAPDVLVAFGRPKGDRTAYRQWREEDTPPQVVFEIMSPSNRFHEMMQKLAFYDKYGVEEYYLYDPDRGVLDGWVRREGRLQPIEQLQGWVSPRLGVRFELDEDGQLILTRPDGQRFLSPEEIEAQREEALRAAERERQRAERLAARLRELGIEDVE